jgi:hypothetical protein
MRQTGSDLSGPRSDAAGGSMRPALRPYRLCVFITAGRQPASAARSPVLIRSAISSCTPGITSLYDPPQAGSAHDLVITTR